MEESFFLVLLSLAFLFIFIFLCRSLERSHFEVGKHVLRREMISKFTLAMIEASFFYCIFINVVIENGKS